MPYHIERFIHEVEEMPGVWDKSSNDYKDFVKREMRWTRIAKNLHIYNWNDYSEKKQETIIKDLQIQWRELKQGYYRARDMRENPELYEIDEKMKKTLKKEWKLYRQLSFLPYPPPTNSKGANGDERHDLNALNRPGRSRRGKYNDDPENGKRYHG